jgi:hypothetical protein
MNEGNRESMNCEQQEEAVGEDGIPNLGDPEVQTRFQQIWDEAGPEERDTISAAWGDACAFNERERFTRAVAAGKSALLAVDEEIQEESAARFSLYSLFWDIKKSHDPDALTALLMAIANEMRRPRSKAILALLKDRQRQIVKATVKHHYDVLRWLLVEQPDPDLLPCSARLRDLGGDACNMIYDTIETIWENVDKIERELRIPPSAAGIPRPAPRPKCPVCRKRPRDQTDATAGTRSARGGQR